MRILVIEDDEDLADAIVRRLRRLGHAVDWQNDGLSADGVLQYESFDLVILDIGLPRMSGFDILHRLRDRGSKIPVLALTARIDIEDRVHALDTGADDYLAKPFDFRELEARCRAVAPAQRAGRRRAAFRRSGHRQRRAPAHAGRPAHRAAQARIQPAGDPAGRHEPRRQQGRDRQQAVRLDDDAAPNAIEVYIARLRRKLEGSPLRIETRRGTGYILTCSDDGKPDAPAGG